MKEDLLKRILACGVVEEGNFSLSGGGVSEFYLNIKKSFGEQQILRDLAAVITEDIKKYPDVNFVAGYGFGGVILASAISLTAGLNGVYIRNEKKGYGMRLIMEGKIPSESDGVYLVDDVLTTGRSLKTALHVLSYTESKIFSAGVVVNRNSIFQSTIPLYSIFTSKDFGLNG